MKTQLHDFEEQIRALGENPLSWLSKSKLHYEVDTVQDWYRPSKPKSP